MKSERGHWKRWAFTSAKTSGQGWGWGCRGPQTSEPPAVPVMLLAKLLGSRAGELLGCDKGMGGLGFRWTVLYVGLASGTAGS